VVGKFWRPTSGVHPIEADEFAGFDTPGFAKGAWNFVVSERPARGSKVETETRVACTDDDARHRFSRYWWRIGPFSALIRRVMLREIKRDAERKDFGVARPE
jgi:hypothetical protein